jgi:hypothetical protein
MPEMLAQHLAGALNIAAEREIEQLAVLDGEIGADGGDEA